MDSKNKTVAERLRETKGASLPCRGDILAFALGRKLDCPIGDDCINCIGRLASELADTIEAEQAERQLPEGIEWPRFEDGELVKFGDEYVAYTGEARTVERVSFISGETFVNGISRDKPMKRPEPEVLDADGVPIKVGDTVYTPQRKALVVLRLDAPYVWSKEGLTRADYVTHRKPDTQEAINHDAMLMISESFFDQRRDEFEDRVFDLLKRQRKLLGGE